jgi:hypothetical protein
MWDFNSGAQTPGIATAAVATHTVATNAITESITFSSPAAITLTPGSQVQVALLTIPSLQPGDQVWVVFKAVCSLNDPLVATVVTFLREDSTGGPIVDEAFNVTMGSVMLQTVFTAGSAITNKRFVVSAEQVGASTVGFLSWIQFFALRRQR